MFLLRREVDRLLCPVCGEAPARPLRLDYPRDLYRCLRCRLVHARISAEDWTPEQYYKNYYTGKSPEFDTITELRYGSLLAECERIHRRGRLLDVGCGAGHLLLSATRRGWAAVGQEVSVSGLEWLEGLKARTGCDFEILRDDLLEARLPPASFAAITLIEVLEHLPLPAETLSRCFALLEPGGVLYLTTPNFDSLTRRLLGVGWRGLVPDHLRLFNVRSLRTALVQTGFRVRRVVSRNVDIPEIVLKLRHGPAKAAWEQHTFATTLDLRQRVESSQLLRGVKRGVNMALMATRLGDTLEAFATKPA